MSSMRNYLLLISIIALPILAEAKLNYNSKLSCQNMEGNLSATISESDSIESRTVTISWLRDGKLLNKKLEFIANAKYPLEQNYIYNFPNGAGPSYLDITKKSYYFLGKEYIHASLSGMLFDDNRGSGETNLGCSISNE